MAEPRLTAYLAAPGARAELDAELRAQLDGSANASAVSGAAQESGVASRANMQPVAELEWHGDLALLRGASVASAWAADVFPNAEIVGIASIGDAAKQLRARGRNWVHLSLEHHRRAELIVEKLPRFRPRPMRFGDAIPKAPLGHFGLLEKDRMLVLPAGRTGLALGALPFEEDREGPPSRAYLKLWEALTRLGRRPAAGELCVDLGSSPGGWTWVLLSLGARVVAIDKAPLAPEVVVLGEQLDRDAPEHAPHLIPVQGSAFAPLPPEAARARWIVCDVICYPERLLRLLTDLSAAEEPLNLIATIKLQGPAEPTLADAFRRLPRARVEHLHHNKNELCFTSLAPDC